MCFHFIIGVPHIKFWADTIDTNNFIMVLVYSCMMFMLFCKLVLVYTHTFIWTCLSSFKCFFASSRANYLEDRHDRRTKTETHSQHNMFDKLFFFTHLLNNVKCLQRYAWNFLIMLKRLESNTYWQNMN